jgi:ribonuclease Z
MAQILTEACEYHTPTLDVAAMARDAGVQRLILSHIIPPIADEGPVAEQYVAGMSDIFGGEIVLARDLQRFVLSE